MLFKTCTGCLKQWKDREEFLADGELTLTGYQANFRDLEAGLFLFNHLALDCGTTLALKACEFADLYHGPIFRKRLTGAPECPGYCLKATELRPCPQACECAFVREVLQVVAHWPREPVSRGEKGKLKA